MKSWYIIAFLSVAAILATTLPQPVAAADAPPNYVSNINYVLEQPFGGTRSVANPTQYIQLVYSFALGIVGIIATVLIMMGGVQWISAAGNEAIIGKAKEIIIAAVTGLVIALLSYIILLVINPKLINIGFNLQKIAITADSKLWTYDKCTTSTFAGQTCVASDGSSANCETLACGLSGLANGKPCRADVCTTTGEKCYPDTTDPQRKASCQPVDCGSWSEYCSKSYPGPDKSEEYKKCLCEYYQVNILPGFGQNNTTEDRLNMTEVQTNRFNTMCSELIPQASWLSMVTDTSATGFGSGLAVAPSIAAAAIYNCHFSCAATTDFELTASGCALTSGCSEVEMAACLPK